MKAIQLGLFLSFALLPLSLFAATDKLVLSTDNNHDRTISELTIKKGQDFILVKPNPPHLNNNEMVLQTKNYNLFTTATLADLQDPNAFKKLLIARIGRDGTIRVYTLSNLSYISLEKTKNPQGQDDFYLMRKHDKDKIVTIKIKPMPQLLYDPNAPANIKKKSG